MRTTKQLILAVLIVVAAMALLAALIIWPNYREAAAVRQQVRELHERLARLGDRTQEVARLGQEVQAARQHVQNDLKIVPESADVASLIRKLSYPIDGMTVADQTFTAGSPADAIVTALATSPEPETAKDRPTPQAMPVTAELFATFESVLGLIVQAESMERLVRVSSVRVSCQREQQQQMKTTTTTTEIPLLKASIGLEVIYDPAPPPAAIAVGTANTQEPY
jgi:hypothetical protein